MAPIGPHATSPTPHEVYELTHLYLLMLACWITMVLLALWNIADDLIHRNAERAKASRRPIAAAERRFIEPCAESLHEWVDEDGEQVCTRCKRHQSSN